MITRSNTPTEAHPWLNEDVRAALDAIQPPHIEKKRHTVILLAFARANQTPVMDVFSRPDTCHASIWYDKWARLPDVKAAFDTCYRRALDYADEETAAIESFYTRQRRQDIGKYAAQAPAALATVMVSSEQRGSDRINAALALIKLADPETRDVNTPPGAAETTGPIVILPDNGRDPEPRRPADTETSP